MAPDAGHLEYSSIKDPTRQEKRSISVLMDKSNQGESKFKSLHGLNKIVDVNLAGTRVKLLSRL